MSRKVKYSGPQPGGTYRPNPAPVVIKPGQVWRDKDKRREEDGIVRTFRVTGVKFDGRWIECRNPGTGRVYGFAAKRFGSGRANDSFELVEDV
jgi:hypothetical protein